jgi:protein-L-isoaspartate(D-aspartate) O-methyltransferase
MAIVPLLPWLVALSAVVAFGASIDADQAARATAQDADRYARLRHAMVDQQIAGRDVRDAAVLDAMRQVPRHLFVPPDLAASAYVDSPLPIGHGQTISQPYIVGLMTELARPRRSDKVLEIGTGCGYQAAVLSRLVSVVYTIEIVAPLAEEARTRLARLGYLNVRTLAGDGYLGWPEEAPFDIIIVTAAPEQVPQALVDQLAPRGRMVIPVGGQLSGQDLQVIEKDEAGRVHRKGVLPVRFVPMVHK